MMKHIISSVNSILIFSLFISFCFFSCVKKKEICDTNIYYYKLNIYDRLFMDEDTYIPDTIYTYEARIITDSANNERTVEYYYFRKEYPVKYSGTFHYRREPWGLSRKAKGNIKPSLRIDTYENVLWEFPLDTAKDIFSTNYRFIGLDTIKLETDANAIPVYVFEASGYYFNNKKYQYFNKNFILVREISEYFPEIYSYEMNQVSAEEVPDEYRLQMDSIMIAKQARD